MPTRYEVAAYDHGFRKPQTARRFATLAEAEEYVAAQPSGRRVSFTGRVIEDLAWRITDLATEGPPIWLPKGRRSGYRRATDLATEGP